MDNNPQHLDAAFWQQRYQTGDTGWDLGAPSPPMVSFADTLSDTSVRILIPGCGNAWEAEYLLEKGCKNVTLIDIAEGAVQTLREKFAGHPAVHVVHGDFFEHKGEYDLILEQTFFCALDPVLRPAYVKQAARLLSPGGRICGLLFNVEFPFQGPPFGGTLSEYESLFQTAFDFSFSPCLDSHPKRAGQEFWVEIHKK
ncbi:MAG: methyltransferase domain-containing protein [Bacteroidetes bacterium]|nr:methyltransferase domain-containing protein [Bacteroidota bacterium]